MADAAAAPAGADAAGGEECSICWAAAVDACTLDGCAHQFCSVCISAWYRRRGPSSDTCPLCRKEYAAARRADGSGVDLEGRTFVVRLAGVTHDGRQERVRRLRPGDAVQLVREPHNPHDARAVAVHDEDGNSLGYVPRVLTDTFHDEPPLQAVVNEVGLFATRDGREVAWANLLVQDR